MVKRIVLLASFVLVIFVIYNCDDAGIVENTNGYEISGTVNGWTQPSRILKALVFGSSPSQVFLADSTRIEANGNFIIRLKEPSDNVKYVYTVVGDSTCTNNVIISPAGFKYTKVQLNVYNDSNIFLGRILRAFAYPPAIAGSVLVDYYHFDETVSLNGVMSCISATDTNIARFSYSGVKGWNKAVLHFNSYTLTNRDIELSNSEPVGVAWQYTP